MLPTIPSLMSTLDESSQSIESLNEELESSRLKLMTFMAFLCHEVQSPLYVISANVSFLEDVEESGWHGSNDALQSISQSADLMLRLVNDVLDISKLETGQVDLQEEDFDLRGTLEGVARSMESFVREKHKGAVVMQTVLEDSIPRSACADAGRLLQIVYNLLSNANKFTEQGLISFVVSLVGPDELVSRGDVSDEPIPEEETNEDVLEAGLEDGIAMRLLEDTSNPKPIAKGKIARHEDHHRICLKISVQDTGIGISPERLESLFHPYAQSKLSSYRAQGGTGLGLAIVSKLCNVMGGKIYVSSTLGAGTKFDAYITVKPAAPSSSRNEDSGRFVTEKEVST